ncbi:MAG: hypothetical protein NVS9B4_18320 [Candidatus Acidiferrum sp.]
MKGWKVWQRNKKHKDLAEHRVVKAVEATAAVTADPEVVMAALDGKADLVAEAPAGHGAGSANISARKRFASSAWNAWTLSTTSALTFCRSSCKSAGRFCRGA